MNAHVHAYAWRCGVATFGLHTTRTSALAHLVAADQRTTACGVKLAASKPEPLDNRQIRCGRCIEARAKG